MVISSVINRMLIYGNTPTWFWLVCVALSRPQLLMARLAVDVVLMWCDDRAKEQQRPSDIDPRIYFYTARLCQ